jgi:hypothetical protein
MFLVNNHIHRWLVLIPHRDSLKPIVELQHHLRQQGVWGSRLLPPVAFLNAVEKPVGEDTRKRIAQIIREQSLEHESKGYIDGLSPDLYHLPYLGEALGIPLSLDLTPELLQLTTHIDVPSPLLILALGADQQALDLAKTYYAGISPFHFRQGSVANLAFTLQGELHSSIQLHWELGKPTWMAHYG